MAWTSAIVLYVVIWMIVFFALLPLGQVSQAEAGKVEPGTPASAPADPKLGKKALWTTLWATLLFAVVFSVIQFGLITLDEIPFFSRPDSST